MQKTLIFFIAYLIAGFSFLNPLTAQVTSLEILDASLETVFLNLTGKSLRE